MFVSIYVHLCACIAVAEPKQSSAAESLLWSDFQPGM